MRTNDNGTVVTVQKATRLMVIALFSYIVMLLLSPFHSPHVLHSKNKEKVNLCIIHRHTEDIQMKHTEGLTAIWMVRCNVNPL